jgi:hypothetical protein
MARSSKIISVVAVLLLVVLAAPFSAVHVAKAGCTASDVWVAPPPVGNDANPGTAAQPFATIQHGIDVVCGGGTVYVAAGTYHENLVIGSAQNLIGAGAPDTIIDGGGDDTVVRVSSEPSPNTISGFTIQNGNVLLTSIWEPAKENVLYAGIKLPSIKMLPQLFSTISCGGGIYIGETHIVTLNDCTIKDNEAEEGGGICNRGQLYMNRCTVSGNTAMSEGGGIYNAPTAFLGSGKMWLTNCTISGNSATEPISGYHQQTPTFGAAIVNAISINGDGGGIFNAGDMELLNCTIANNSAEDYGGGFVNLAPDTAIFKNTIVANNTAGVPGTNNCFNGPSGVITSLGHNLDSENSCGFNQPTDLINTNPLLGPLHDNGGPTFTHALLHGSPAIDKGGDPIAVVTDQRGVPRPQGTALDIGAYELAQASVDTSTNTGTASFSTLDGYITDLTAFNESQTDCGPFPDFNFPFGLFSFNVTDITPGSTATVVIILPSNASTNTEYWKCLNGQWVDCTSLLGSNDGDQVLTLALTDGGLGDGDGQANGQISDPGGPVMLVSATPTHPKVSPSLPRLLNPPQMSVQYLSVSPKQATANQPVTISTNVVNTGDAGGNLSVALKINGQVEQTKMVAVGPQAAQPIKFTVTKAQPGTYSVDIGGQKGSFTIPSAGNNRVPVSGGLIAFLIMGVLVIASVMVLLLSRRPA